MLWRYMVLGSRLCGTKYYELVGADRYISKRTPISRRRFPPALARREPSRLVRIQQHRGVVALETGEHAAVGILDDALRILVGARAQEHADHDVVLGPRAVFAQELIAETSQPLVDFIGESQPREIVAVAGTHLRFLSDLDYQTHDESGLVDQP